jgi:Ca2+-binding EF-hand superfamily protein
MGNQQISQDNVNKIKKNTDCKIILNKVKEKEIKKIHKNFASLDKAKKGYVTVDDLSKLPEIEKNPLRYYICQSFKQKVFHDDEINFEQFVRAIDIFKNGKLQEQYQCKFLIILVIYELFDYNKDGKICNEDLLVNLKLLIGPSLNEEQLRDIVDKTIQEFAVDQKYITFEDFLKILEM